MKKATIIYPIDWKNRLVLLGEKQQKVAAGYLAGYGGKSEPKDRNFSHTSQREFFEETGEGIRAQEEDFVLCAVIDFDLGYSEKESFKMKVFVYTIDFEKCSGNFSDSDEMKNHDWFPLHEMPYNKMLPDNQLFLPKILKGERFTGQIVSYDNIITLSEFNPSDKKELDELSSYYFKH